MYRFAVRQIGTDKYFPDHRKSARGYSHDEPTSIKEKPPRLFTSWDGARKAMRAWYKGVWVVKRSIPHDSLDEFYDIDVEPVKSRNRVHLEIVRYSLTEMPTAIDPKVKT